MGGFGSLQYSHQIWFCTTVIIQPPRIGKVGEQTLRVLLLPVVGTPYRLPPGKGYRYPGTG
eukprot:733779-Rhodomonas_salina.1